jgi:hypothetical protein
MPKSVYNSDQHSVFRNQQFNFYEDEVHNIFIRELWDCEQIEPLFNIPACVIISSKERLSNLVELREKASSIEGEIIIGNLKSKNSSLSDVEKRISIQKVEYNLNRQGNRTFWDIGAKSVTTKRSHYLDKFYEGATLVPRSFWFVELQSTPLGFDMSKPPVTTDHRAIEKAKPLYSEVKISGPVNFKFFFCTLLSTDILPFGNLEFRKVVLPVIVENNKYELIDEVWAHLNGYYFLEKWLEKAKYEWSIRRGPKLPKMGIYENLNFYQKLTRQKPDSRFRVLYNGIGTYLAATLIDKRNIKIDFGIHQVLDVFLVVDYSTFYYETDDKDEANFLTSILNSNFVDKKIKQIQSRGLWGPRNICAKVFELPIPKFDESNETHLKLAAIGETCERKVKGWLNAGGGENINSIGRLRGMVREYLKDELEEIDKIVKEILE